MTSTLRTLLDRIEKGEGRDEELDVRLVAAFFAPKDAQVMQSPINGAWCIFDGTDRNGRPRLWEHRPLGYQPSPTSSIDAAVALVEKVLPGYDHGYNTSDGIAFGTVWRAGYLDDTVVRGEARTPARAILAATLRAKIAQEGEEAYWSAPKDEDRCTAMAAAYRAMRAAAKADAPDPHVLQDRLHGMLRMAVASEDSFNRLSPAGRRLIQAAEGFFASSREDRDDLNACWDALQAETKRADAAEARLAALLRAKLAQEEGA